MGVTSSNIEDYVPNFAHVIVTCRADGCFNEGIVVDVVEHDLNGDVMCGPCGAQITEITVLGASTDEPEGGGAGG